MCVVLHAVHSAVLNLKIHVIASDVVPNFRYRHDDRDHLPIDGSHGWVRGWLIAIHCDQPIRKSIDKDSINLIRYTHSYNNSACNSILIISIWSAYHSISHPISSFLLPFAIYNIAYTHRPYRTIAEKRNITKYQHTRGEMKWLQHTNIWAGLVTLGVLDLLDARKCSRP